MSKWGKRSRWLNQRWAVNTSDSAAPFQEECSSRNAPAKVRASPKAKSLAWYSKWGPLFRANSIRRAPAFNSRSPDSPQEEPSAADWMRDWNAVRTWPLLLLIARRTSKLSILVVPSQMAVTWNYQNDLFQLIQLSSLKKNIHFVHHLCVYQFKENHDRSVWHFPVASNYLPVLDSLYVFLFDWLA